MEWVTDGRSGPIRLSGLQDSACNYEDHIQKEMIYDHVVTVVCLDLAPVGLGTCKQCIASLMKFYQREESNFKYSIDHPTNFKYQVDHPTNPVKQNLRTIRANLKLSPQSIN